MKDALLPIALVVALVAGLWYYFSIGSKNHTEAAYNPLPADTRAAPPAVKKTPPTVRRAPKPEPAAAIEEPVVRPARLEIAKATPPVPKPVPASSVNAVKTGMNSSQVIDLLGEPKLTAITVDKGTLLETYIYERKPPNDVWMIYLRGGLVNPH
jgi:hypothetical protein